jgi:hypothetical protein
MEQIKNNDDDENDSNFPCFLFIFLLWTEYGSLLGC